jgi:uncharacterized protein with PIN domain/sulfur carrier protein ThiS
MATAHLRFYEELNDFLAPPLRKAGIDHCFDRRTTVKHMIESLGVPHTEIELILVNSQSVGFSHIVEDGDRISVYPLFETLDVASLICLRPQPLRKTRFVVDCNLGRLARYLRLLGLDCLYENDFDDETVARLSQQQRRIVLTRDRRLLHRKIITHGFYVRAELPKQQVREVLRRLDLYGTVRPFTRCTRCNGLLEATAKEAVEHLLEPKTRRYYDSFLRCKRCGQVYWRGSHHGRAEKLVQGFLQDAQGAAVS